MPDLRWPLVVATAVLALALFFGFNYYKQRYLHEEPLLAALQEMESVGSVQLSKEGDGYTLLVTPAADYHGGLRELLSAVERKVEGRIQDSLSVEFDDRRNGRLEDFAEQITPALYESARLGNYREAAAAVEATGERHQVQEVRFSVDQRYLYVQARDGEHYLLLLVSLEQEEGGSS